MIMLPEMKMTMIDNVDQNFYIGINYTDDDCNDHGIDHAADDDDNGNGNDDDDVDDHRSKHNDDDDDHQ